MTKQELISENEKHMTNESLAAITSAPEAAWETIVAAAAAIDAEDIGIDCEAATTHETMEDFDNSRMNHWSERGKRVAGSGFVVYENIQITKGQRRQRLAVIDCGDFRLCLTA
jgi:hypothetical protein